MPLLRLFFAFIFMAVLTSGEVCAQKKETVITKKYAPAQLKEDAQVLTKVLLAMHPAIGIYQPRSWYQRLFLNFENSFTDSLTEKEFRLRTKLLVDELHCGHTEVLYSKRYYREMNRLRLNYSPFVFLPMQNKAYMIANLNKKQDSILRRGTEITSINGIGVDSILRYSKRYISSDGYNETAKNHYIQLSFNSFLLGLFGRPDTFNVEYKQGIALNHLYYPAFKPKRMPPLTLGPKDDSTFHYFKRAKIKYRFMDRNNKDMWVKIERFTHTGDAKAYRRIFKKLKKNKSENLIIDLRNNGGGSLANTYRLLSYLLVTSETQTLRTTIKKYPYKKYTKGNWSFLLTRTAYKLIGKKITVHDTDNFVYTIKPRKKNHYDGKLIVLINGGSFSASCLVSAYLKKNNRALFLGEETGGTIEGCNAGVTPFYKLPNTKIRVRVPAFRIVHDVNPTITGHGIIPDYPTYYSLKDILNKRDVELKLVKDLLKLNKTAKN